MKIKAIYKLPKNKCAFFIAPSDHRKKQFEPRNTDSKKSKDLLLSTLQEKSCISSSISHKWRLSQILEQDFLDGLKEAEASIDLLSSPSFNDNSDYLNFLCMNAGKCKDYEGSYETPKNLGCVEKEDLIEVSIF